MNDAFRSMSDLVADAEDLLLKLEKLQIPETSALTEKVQDSIDDMRGYLRRKLKHSSVETAPLLWAAIGIFSVIVILTVLRRAKPS